MTGELSQFLYNQDIAPDDIVDIISKYQDLGLAVINGSEGRYVLWGDPEQDLSDKISRAVMPYISVGTDFGISFFKEEGKE
jgi:hypothetical protein